MLMPSGHAAAGGGERAATEVVMASGPKLLPKAMSGSVIMFMTSVSTWSLDTCCAEPALPLPGPGMSGSDLHRILPQVSWS